jgi:hypothetical protein
MSNNYIEKTVKPYIPHRIVFGIIFSTAVISYLIKNQSDIVYSKDHKTGNKSLNKGLVGFYTIILVFLGAFLDLIFIITLKALSGNLYL